VKFFDRSDHRTSRKFLATLLLPAGLLVFSFVIRTPISDRCGAYFSLQPRFSAAVLVARVYTSILLILGLHRVFKGFISIRGSKLPPYPHGPYRDPTNSFTPIGSTLGSTWRAILAQSLFPWLPLCLTAMVAVTSILYGACQFCGDLESTRCIHSSATIIPLFERSLVLMQEWRKYYFISLARLDVFPPGYLVITMNAAQVASITCASILITRARGNRVLAALTGAVCLMCLVLHLLVLNETFKPEFSQSEFGNRFFDADVFVLSRLFPAVAAATCIGAIACVARRLRRCPRASPRR